MNCPTILLDWHDKTKLVPNFSHLPKKMCYLLYWKPFKNEEKCFLFRLKIFFISSKSFDLCFINWPNFIVWLPLLLEILGGMCIKIICERGCNVIKFKINLIFLIKPFRYMTKKSRQKLKYLENERSFWGEIQKTFFIIFKGLLVAKNCLRPDIAP